MKTVLITGASGALGTAVAAEFRQHGWQVVSIQAPKPGRLPESHTFIADLTDEQQVLAVVNEIVLKFGGIDAALLLVGGFEGGGIEHSDSGVVQRMFNLNVLTAWHVLRPVMLHFRKSGRHGKVILTGAANALDPEKGRHNFAYAWSKASLMSVAAMLNKDAPATVTGLLLPGTIDTAANRSFSPGADFSAWDKPEDLALEIRNFAEIGQASEKIIIP